MGGSDLRVYINTEMQARGVSINGKTLFQPLLHKKHDRSLCFPAFVSLHSIQGGAQPHLVCSKRLVVCTLRLRVIESDPHIICSLHPHVARSNPFATLKPQPFFEVQRQPWFENFPVDASMDNYKKRQQQQHGSDFMPTRGADEGRRTKMRMEKEITDGNNKDSSGKISNSTSSSLHKKPQPNGAGGGYRGRSPRPGFDPQTNGLCKTSAKGPSLPPQPGFDPQTNYALYKSSDRGPILPPWPSENEKKVVNWRLACFMCNEYLTRGTLLGRSWPPRDSKPNWHESDDKSQAKSDSFDEDGDESRREKERVYHTITDFLQEGDVHLPGIVNPSQLAAWLGL